MRQAPWHAGSSGHGWIWSDSVMGCLLRAAHALPSHIVLGGWPARCRFAPPSRCLSPSLGGLGSPAL
eukprot:12355129-Prorocentrum_lima.AAC.1